MSKKILLVEDDSDWRQLTAMALREAGYEVKSVSGAAEALLQKDESGLGGIVLDLDLGGENGMMLMQHLQRNHPDVAIILYTGIEHDDATVRMMLEQGARRYVRKGSFPALLAAVQSALG